MKRWEDGNFPIAPPFLAPINRRQRIAMTHRANAPAGLLVPTIPVAKQVGKTLQQPLMLFDVGKVFGHQLQHEWPIANILAQATHLGHLAAIAQEQMLFAVIPLQQCLAATHLIETNPATNSIPIPTAHIGEQHPPIALNAPENIRLKGGMVWIGERYKAPRSRLARCAA